LFDRPLPRQQVICCHDNDDSDDFQSLSSRIPAIDSAPSRVMESLNKWTRQLSFVVLLGVVVSAFIAGILAGPSVKSSISSLLTSVARLSRSSPTNDSDIARLAAQYRKACPQHKFTSVRQLSRVPNMWYIEDFLSGAEIGALLHFSYATQP
jgi:hypothetical protein